MLAIHDVMNRTKYIAWGISFKQRNENNGGTMDANSAMNKYPSIDIDGNKGLLALYCSTKCDAKRSKESTSKTMFL